jgi:hypothetical protein
MAPFWTRLPIQSWAPITRSGPLPAWEAVTNTVWRSLETVWTFTLRSFCSPHLAAESLIALEYLSSAQMVSEAPPSEPVSDAPPPAPQPARSSISPTMMAEVVHRPRMCAPLSALSALSASPDGCLGP